MTKNKILLVLLIALLIIPMFAFARVDVSMNSKYTVYQNEVAEIPITIKNISDKETTVTLQITESKYEGLVTPIEKEITIGYNKKFLTKLYVNPVVPTGEYRIVLTAKDERETKAGFLIKVLEEDPVDITMKSYIENQCKCKESIYTFNVSNNSTNNKDVEVVAKIGEEKISSVKKTVLSKTGENIKVPINFACDENVLENTINFDVKVNNEVRKSFSAAYKLGDCVAPSITYDTEFTRCMDELANNKLTVNIKSNSAIKKTYEVITNNDIEVSQDTFSIDQNQTKSLTLTLPKTYSKEKDYSFELKLYNTNNTNELIVAKLKVNNSTCSVIELNYDKENVCINNEKTLKATLKNNSEKEQIINYQVFTNKESQDKNITLKANETKDIEFKVAPNSYSDNKAYVVVLGDKSLKYTINYDVSNCSGKDFIITDTALCKQNNLVFGNIGVRNISNNDVNAGFLLQAPHITLREINRYVEGESSIVLSITKKTDKEHIDPYYGYELGNKKIKLKISNANTKEELFFEDVIDVNKIETCTSDILVNVPNKNKVAQMNSATDMIGVLNLSAENQTVKIKANKNWIYFKEEEMVLEKFEIHELPFYIRPDMKTEAKEHDVKIDFLVDEKVVSTATVKIDVLNRQQIELSVDKTIQENLDRYKEDEEENNSSENTTKPEELVDYNVSNVQLASILETENIDDKVLVSGTFSIPGKRVVKVSSKEDINFTVSKGDSIVQTSTKVDFKLLLPKDKFNQENIEVPIEFTLDDNQVKESKLLISNDEVVRINNTTGFLVFGTASLFVLLILLVVIAFVLAPRKPKEKRDWTYGHSFQKKGEEKIDLKEEVAKKAKESSPSKRSKIFKMD